MMENKMKNKSKTPWGLIVGIGCGCVAFVVVIIVVVVCGYWGLRISSPDKENGDSESEWKEWVWNGKDVKYSGPMDSEGKPHGKGKMRIPNSSGTDLYDGPFEHGVMEGKNAVYYSVEEAYNFEGEMRNNEFYEGKWIEKGNETFFFKGKFRDMHPYNGTWYYQGKKRGETVNGVSSPDDLFM